MRTFCIFMTVCMLRGLAYANDAREPKIYNLTCTNANTEYSQQLRTKIVGLRIYCRQGYDLKLSYVSGQSGTVYISIPGGSSYSAPELDGFIARKTIYVQSPTAGAIVEIEDWQ